MIAAVFWPVALVIAVWLVCRAAHDIVRQRMAAQTAHWATVNRLVDRIDLYIDRWYAATSSARTVPTEIVTALCDTAAPLVQDWIEARKLEAEHRRAPPRVQTDAIPRDLMARAQAEQGGTWAYDQFLGRVRELFAETSDWDAVRRHPDILNGAQ